MLRGFFGHAFDRLDLLENVGGRLKKLDREGETQRRRVVEHINDISSSLPFHRSPFTVRQLAVFEQLEMC